MSGSPHYPKPQHKPSLPPSFKVVDKTTSKLETLSALREAKIDEFLLSYLRCGHPNTADDHTYVIPTWHGVHSLISTANVPLMRVGFGVVIPNPVTVYGTVRKAMQNFQSVRRQINPAQTVIPVFADEGVYHTLADILMEEHEEFSDVHGMMGNFHWAKNLLKCSGRFLRGSGMDDALVENQIFGKNVLNQALEGRHYVRSLYCVLLVSDLISTLAFEAFSDWCEDNDVQLDDNIIDSATNMQELLHQKQRCPAEFQEFRILAPALMTKFESFLSECIEKSEVCQYLQLFQHIANVVKLTVTADREGNFALHMGAAEESLPIYRENDCLNYLRYGMHYIETTFALEEKAPDVFEKFIEGYFVVKEHEGFFNAVAPDMKLEQTGQRSSKSCGGLVGQTRNLKYMIEWLIVFHEVVLISNTFHDLMHDTSMDHSEVAPIHHDLVGNKAVSFNENVIKLFNFMSNKGNPFMVYKVPAYVKMQNLITRQLVDEETAKRHLKLIENGSKLVQEFRMERFVEQKKKLGHTISKRSMPRMDFKPNHSSLLAPTPITTKIVAAAQREIDIARERGMSAATIYEHDFLPTSSLFDGKLPKKVTSKSQLVTELEQSQARRTTCSYFRFYVAS